MNRRTLVLCRPPIWPRCAAGHGIRPPSPAGGRPRPQPPPPCRRAVLHNIGTYCTTLVHIARCSGPRHLVSPSMSLRTKAASAASPSAPSLSAYRSRSSCMECWVQWWQHLAQQAEVLGRLGPLALLQAHVQEGGEPDQALLSLRQGRQLAPLVAPAERSNLSCTALHCTVLYCCVTFSQRYLRSLSLNSALSRSASLVSLEGKA
jgi:hypothetical protein